MEPHSTSPTSTLRTPVSPPKVPVASKAGVPVAKPLKMYWPSTWVLPSTTSWSSSCCASWAITARWVAS